MELLIIIGLVLALLCGVPLLIGFAIGQSVERRRWRRSGAIAPHTAPQQAYPTLYAPQAPEQEHWPPAEPREPAPYVPGPDPHAWQQPDDTHTHRSVQPAQPAQPAAPTGPFGSEGPAQEHLVPWHQQAPAQNAVVQNAVAQITSEQRTPEQLAAEKKRRERRNINVALYIGGLLLVAAALSFVAVVGGSRSDRHQPGCCLPGFHCRRLPDRALLHSASPGGDPVSYTHLTLPTNREV